MKIISISNIATSDDETVKVFDIEYKNYGFWAKIKTRKAFKKHTSSFVSWLDTDETIFQYEPINAILKFNKEKFTV